MRECVGASVRAHVKVCVHACVHWCVSVLLREFSCTCVLVFVRAYVCAGERACVCVRESKSACESTCILA